MSKKIIIAIDGPAGSGKSTLAKFLADELGFIYLDTGAMYRAITYLCINKNIVENLQEIEELIEEISIDIKYENGLTRVFINSEELTDKIRTFEVNSKVSIIAKIPVIRNYLVKIQQQLANDNNVVAEGRDTTTVVFPNADLKIFLVASIKARAERRLKEFREKDSSVTLEDVVENLKERDRIDSSREMSPLRKAEDAVELDTTNMSVADEIDTILARVDEIKKIK